MDLSGVWYGHYVGHNDPQQNSFIALLVEQEGSITGKITEPDGDGGIRHATVTGSRMGEKLIFLKQYYGKWDHAVRYSGQLDAQATSVRGNWSFQWLKGGFEMRRQIFSVEDLAADHSVTVGNDL